MTSKKIKEAKGEQKFAAASEAAAKGAEAGGKEWSKTFDAITDFVFIQDKDFKFVKVNKTFCDALKKKPEDLIGKKCYEILHKSDKPWPNCPFAKTLKDKRPHTEEVNDPNIGVPLLISTSPLFDKKGEVTGVVHIAKDITERKKAGEALQKSEQWFSTTLKSIGDAVIATDTKGNVIFLNSIAEFLTGWKQEEAAGKPLNKILNIINEKTGKPVENPIKRVLREGVIVGLANHTVLIAKDGKRYPIADSGAPIKDNKGKIIGAVMVLRDITEHKKADEEKERLLYNVSERIKELNCLYSLSKLVEKPDISVEGILQGIVKLLPTAWQYPDITCAKIAFEDKEFKTEGFKTSKWKQSADIKVHGERVGIIEVCYLEEKPKTYEGPFLKQERKLIDAIAERLGKITQRKRTEEALQKSEQWFSTTLKSIGDAVIATDTKGNVIFLNSIAEFLTGWKQEEAAGKPLNKILNIINEKTYLRSDYTHER